MATESHHSTVSCETQPIRSLREQAATGLNNAKPQSFSSHALPSNSYEFALHGLLALGSTSGMHEGAGFFPTSDANVRQAISIHDFANSDAVDPTSGDNHEQRPDLHRIETGHQSNSTSISTTEQTALDPSLESDNYIRPITSNQIPETTNSNLSKPTWTPSSDLIQVDQSMELLKFYRYHIAPWVRQRELLLNS